MVATGPHLVPDALELGQLSQMALVGAVGKIKAGGVHAEQINWR
jgi:hypothetical protein